MKAKCFFTTTLLIGTFFLFLGLAAMPVAAAEPAAKGATDASAYAKPGFHTEMEDGRLWVFKEGSEELENYRSKGELAKHVVRPGAGPGGMTLKAPDAETLDSYLSQP